MYPPREAKGREALDVGGYTAKLEPSVDVSRDFQPITTSIPGLNGRLRRRASEIEM